MSPEQQNIKIAEACGKTGFFVLKKRGLYYRENAHGYTDRIAEAWRVPEEIAKRHVCPYDEPVTMHPAPIHDYLKDLNAMHEAEKTLPDKHKRTFAFMLAQVLDTSPTVDLDDQFANIHATAAQRAEAFRKTLNLWEDAP